MPFRRVLRSIRRLPFFSTPRRRPVCPTLRRFARGMWRDAPQPVAQGCLSSLLMPSARRELATAGAAGEADGGRRRGGQMDPADLGATELTARFAKSSLSPLEALDAAEAR